jgi:predicted flap endonuclease-1-like 5' DNA nuclease
MLRNAVNFKNVIDLAAGVVGLVFDKLEGLTTDKLASAEPEEVEPAESEEVESAKSDDLTEISGIGRAFAQRLNEAGILTYQQLANMSADQVREVTRAAQWQGDPASWIAEAERLAEA